MSKFDFLCAKDKSKIPDSTGSNGIGSIDQWECPHCGTDNCEDPMTPRKNRKFICRNCGKTRFGTTDTERLHDGNYMVFDWRAHLFSSVWKEKNGDYSLKFGEYELTLFSGNEVICQKSFYCTLGGESVGNSCHDIITMPDMINPEDDTGFGEFSYFKYQGGSSPLLGAVVRETGTVFVEFEYEYIGFRKISLQDALKAMNSMNGQSVLKTSTGSTQLNAWVCSCGSVNRSKFCGECGKSVDSQK